MLNLRGIILSVIYILASSTVLGCGPLASGQERIIRFNVNGFKLALPMVYTDHLPSRSIYPNVSESAMVAQTFLRNLIMRATSDVLEGQGRSAGLPDAVISLILDQLTLNVTYEPFHCDSVSSASIMAEEALRTDMKQNCLTTSNTVTSICTMKTKVNCEMMQHIQGIPQKHYTITGTLKVGNIIMAGWSNQMWQTVLNRVARVLSSGPFGTNFLASAVTVV